MASFLSASHYLFQRQFDMASSQQVLRTGISKVMWCDPSKGYAFLPAQIPVMKSESERSEPVFWLDQILGGGFVLPGDGEQRRALTVLLTGPPGTGKSTLALELCYRWGSQGTFTQGWRTLYLTSEAHEPWMITNAQSLGWTDINSKIVTEEDDTKWQPGTILVRNTSDAKQFGKTLARFVSSDKEETQLEPPNFWEQLAELFRKKDAAAVGASSDDQLGGNVPDVVVLDSLNTLPKQEDRIALFENFMRLVGTGPRILICVLNATLGEGMADFWAFATDVVLRLERRYDDSGSGYLTRTIEVVKARYQEHAFGKHQLKTYQKEKPSQEEEDEATTQFRDTFESLIHVSSSKPSTKSVEPARLEEYSDRASKLMRAHPFRSRTDGGLVIFPSIHYVLSRYKRASPTKPDKPIESGIKGMKRLLHKGYPSGRCTALIGGRGGHKSHLAYVELLHRLIRKESEKALVVSLRDDEGVTRGTMEGILKDRWSAPSEKLKLLNPRTQLLKWEAQGRLELTYYPPGYITPEEFFHRLMLSIHRLKASSSGETHVTLVFNSLDQLSSRFPLCVQEEVFIPGIIQMLSGEGISSFFVAARETMVERSAPEDDYYYGLQTMAELILDFERTPVAVNEKLSQP